MSISNNQTEHEFAISRKPSDKIVHPTLKNTRLHDIIESNGYNNKIIIKLVLRKLFKLRDSFYK